MSLNRRRAPLVAAAFATTLLFAGCSAPEDEVAGGSAGRGGAPAVPTTAGLGVPKQNPNANLDPATKARCDAVWGFQLHSYSANVLPTREATEVERLTTGLADFEAQVTSQEPSLAANVKALATHARGVLQKDPKPGATLPENLAADNTAVSGFLVDTCKMTS